MEAKATLLFLLMSLLVTVCCATKANVKVTVRGAAAIARTDENFVCATMDWWPSNKCNYNHCPWGNTSILNLDLEQRLLVNAVKEFAPLRLRIGGTLQDLVVYKVGRRANMRCPHFKRRENAFEFSHGCLEMDRWDVLNNFFKKTGARVTFGLNALLGRTNATSKDSLNLMVGKWDWRNAYDLIKYTAAQGHKIDSYELGNELCGTGVGERIGAKQYARDMIVLKRIVEKLHPHPLTQPKIVGPGGFYDKQWFNTFLKELRPNVVDGLSHHIYNLGGGDDPTLLTNLQDPKFLSQVEDTYQDIEQSIKSFGPSTSAWVSESGGAFNSGGKNVSDKFVNGFWYLDQLGMTSKYNHKVFCRQALIGGNYGLLNKTSFSPNPDYYGALLWHRLMGTNVLATSHKHSPYLRVYSHCSKTTSGVSMLIINLSNSTTFQVRVVGDRPRHHRHTIPREEYHLTPKDGNIQSDVVLLNGTPLKITESLHIPLMKPRLVNAALPIKVAQHSIVFLTLKGFHAPACA